MHKENCILLLGIFILSRFVFQYVSSFSICFEFAIVFDSVCIDQTATAKTIGGA